MQCFMLPRYEGWCWRQTLCLTLCRKGKTQLRPSVLLLPWPHIEKCPPAEYSHICILLTMKHFQIAIVNQCLETPLSIQWPVTVEQAYGFQPHPCSVVTDMHVYKLQGLRYTHRGTPQSPTFSQLHLMTSSLICKIFFFFSLGNMPRMVFLAWADGESCKGSWEYWRSKAPWLSLSLSLDVGWAGRTKSPDQCLSKWDLKPLGC